MKDKTPVPRGASATNKAELSTLQNDATLGREVQSKIGEQLRALYDDVISQGVPDRFADLLKQLEDKGGGDRG